MRAANLAMLLAMALLLAACGKQESVNNRLPPDTGVDAASSSAATAAKRPAVQQKVTEQVGELPSKITRMNEDGTETVEETTSDSGAHNPLLAAVASTVAAGSAAAAAADLAAPTLWQEGVNYTRLVPAQPTNVPPGQVEVLEFFWYGCPHCYAIEPVVQSWLKIKPPYVAFSRVHVMWNDSHRSHARLYYTLESLGKLNELHGEVFKEIQVNGNTLVAGDAAESERIQSAFVKKFGVSADAFKERYHSFPVDTALARADALVQRYRVDAVPTFVVNGKFVADVRTAGSPERLMSLVGDLAAQEHKR